MAEELSHGTSLNDGEKPAPETPPEPEGAVEVPGKGRMVPVGAVIEERRARQTERAERERLSKENEELRKTKENWDLVEPYLPLLATHPKITGKPAVPTPTNQPDPELLEIAESFGFYDADGQPDLARAAKAKTVIDKRSGTTANAAVKPVADSAAQTRAQALRERAYQVTDKNGRPFATRAAIDKVLDDLPIEQQADKNIVTSALLMARGLEPPVGEPLHTEGGQGHSANTKELSPMERAAAKARGLTDEQWVKTRDASPDSNVLE
jgi:hypothetical protein